MKRVLKKFCAVWLAALMLGGMMPAAGLPVSAASTYSMTSLVGKYKTQGRTAVENGAVMLDWSASGVEFTAECEGDISITVNATRLSGNANGGLYFTVVVDGVTQYENKRIPANNNGSVWTSNTTAYPFHITRQGESTFVIAKNLKAGKHTFGIYNQTEACHGAFGIKSITLNGTVTAPPAEQERYIEFVGDSITAGLGNISTGSAFQEYPLYQDATRGWPYRTAQALGADWSVIARSGITAGNGFGWSGASSVSMQTVYPKRRYYSDSSTAYDFKRQPDVIVLCLGTNDIWTANSATDVENGFRRMLTLLRDKNPQAKIVWLYGMMQTDTDTMIKEAVAAFGGAEKGFYALGLPKNASGGQEHPGLAAQTTYATQVTAYIANLLGGNPSPNPPAGSTTTTTTSSVVKPSGSATAAQQPSRTGAQGGATVAVQGNATATGAGDGSAQPSASENAATNTTQKLPTAGSMLTALAVRGYAITPTFDPDTTQYEAVIPRDLTAVDIEYTAVAHVARVEIIGSQRLSVGKDSNVEIVCTAKDGEQQTYTITLRREGGGTIALLLMVAGIAAVIAVAIVCAVLLRKKRLPKEQ